MYKHSPKPAQAMVLIAGMIFVLVMFVGLAVDVGILFSARRTMQEAADAGAFAGATVLYLGGTTAQAVSAATTDVTRNGYTNGVANTTVAVNSPPTAGPFLGLANYIEVILTKSVQTPIVPAANGYTMVAVRATGGAQPSRSGYAIIALDRGNTNKALEIQAAGSVVLNGGGLLVNSTSGTAASNAGLITISPNTLETNVVGNVSGSFPNLTTGYPQGGDPYGGFPKPSTVGLTSQSCAGPVLNPGIFDCKVSGNVNFVMNPGTYIFRGNPNGINLAGGSSLCTGPTCGTPTAAGGVFIYLTTANYPLSTGTCADFALNGNNSSTLSPPTTGAFRGMLIYQDPNCSATLSIGGNGNISTTGTIYAPNAQVAGNGNSAGVSVGQIVAKTVNIQNADFTVNYNSATSATPTVPALVE